MNKAEFWSRVSKTDNGCWLWTGSRHATGYGWSGAERTLAHRVSWEIAHGPVPTGLCVLHDCDTPLCVRPSHLFLGTRRDNAEDRDAKDRVRHGEAHASAKLTEADVREIRRRLAMRHRQYAIARDYNVHRVTIGKIKRGVNWKRA